jgi:hypothetical protein
MKPFSTVLIRSALVLIFLAEAYLAATQPVTTSEAYLYDRFVRPPIRQVFDDGLLNPSVLYAILEKRSVGLFHVSEFSIRIPSLIFGLLYLWSLNRWSSKPLILIPALAPLLFNCFSQAHGTGIALGLVPLAILLPATNPPLAAICLGLAIAADPRFAPLILIYFFKFPRAIFLDRILVPTVVTAFILLVLPLTHATADSCAPAPLTRTELLQARSIANSLRYPAATPVIHLSATPSTQPILSFYRSKYRISTWDFAGPPYDYSVTVTPAAGVTLTPW